MFSRDLNTALPIESYFHLARKQFSRRKPPDPDQTHSWTTLSSCLINFINFSWLWQEYNLHENNTRLIASDSPYSHKPFIFLPITFKQLARCLLIVSIQGPKNICACSQISARAEVMWRSSGSGYESHGCPTCGRAASLHRMCPKVRYVLLSITAQSQDKVWKCCSEKMHHGGAWRACRSVFTLPKSWGKRRLIQLGWTVNVVYGCRRYVSEFVQRRKMRSCIWGASRNCLKSNLLWFLQDALFWLQM